MPALELTMPALVARMHELARRLGLAGFWRWWARELDTLVPAAPRAALVRRRMRPVLAFAGDQATLWLPAMEGGRPVMKSTTAIALTGDPASVSAAGRAALALLPNMIYGGPAAAARVVISLPARDILRKKIVLPSAAEENFRQALAYDLDRHTPFKSDELYFDAAIVDRHATRKTITVDLAAVRRAVVDPVLSHVAAWGANVAAVVPEPPENAAGSRLNLLPDDARSSKSVWTRWQFWVPIALMMAMVIAAVLIPLWQKREYALQLGTLADQARARAAVSETLRAELDGRVNDYNNALERKYAYPGALEIVDAVTKLMPDDTWLTQFELKSMAKGKETQRELLVRGETANAGRLVQLFEESQLFAQAAPRAPTTKIQPGPGEIFDLGAQLKSRAAPAPLALIVTDKPADPTPLPSEPAPVPASGAQPAPGAAAASETSPPAVAKPDAGPAATPGAAPPGGSAMPASPSAAGTAPVPGSGGGSTPARPTTATPSPPTRPADNPRSPTEGPTPAAPAPAAGAPRAQGIGPGSSTR